LGPHANRRCTPQSRRQSFRVSSNSRQIQNRRFHSQDLRWRKCILLGLAAVCSPTNCVISEGHQVGIESDYMFAPRFREMLITKQASTRLGVPPPTRKSFVARPIIQALASRRRLTHPHCWLRWWTRVWTDGFAVRKTRATTRPRG
jgi:hypothetical protein